MIINGDVLEEIKKYEDCSYSMIFSDPPYNLGTVWEIKENGKPDVKGKAIDFMNNKWEGLTGNDLEQMFKDFYRILKHGGYCVFAGQMRQAMAFQYYAIASEFTIIEPIFSYSISNFPKALDVSKSLDKHFGEEREVVYRNPYIDGAKRKRQNINDNRNCYHDYTDNLEKGLLKDSLSKSDLAKKFDGIKSSICPLKQTTNCWFIFRKPFKTGTVIKDIIAYENGDDSITPSGLNIEGGRVPTDDCLGRDGKTSSTKKGLTWKNDSMKATRSNFDVSERYPAQLFLDGSISYKREDIDLSNKDFLEFVGIDSDVISFMETEKAIDYVCQHLDKFDVAKLLDEQSGKLRSTDNFSQGIQASSIYGNDVKVKDSRTVHATNYDHGCSRILHNCGFELEELYQHIYYSKASKFERESLIGNNVQINNHPTLKSLKLIYNIITLFTSVDKEKQKILIPFSGVLSEYIAWLAHGYKEEQIDIIELNLKYIEIGEARVKFWKKHNFFFKEDKKVYNKIKDNIKKDKKDTYVKGMFDKRG